MFSGFETQEGIIKYKFTLNFNKMAGIRELISSFIKCFHLSFSNFFNLNYTGLKPVGYSIYFYEFEKLIRIIIIGLFISTLVRKMSR